MSIKLKIAKIIYESDDISLEQKLKLIKEIRECKVEECDKVKECDEIKEEEEKVEECDEIKEEEEVEDVDEQAVAARAIMGQISHLKDVARIKPDLAPGIGKEIMNLTRRLNMLG
jgi:hypothetical protein